MAMSYSSQQLTAALQRVVEKEKEGKEENTGFASHVSASDLASKSSPGVSRFLRDRAEYREKTQEVNIGRY